MDATEHERQICEALDSLFAVIAERVRTPGGKYALVGFQLDRQGAPEVPDLALVSLGGCLQIVFADMELEFSKCHDLFSRRRWPECGPHAEMKRDTQWN
jgi:hypothetical protein